MTMMLPHLRRLALQSARSQARRSLSDAAPASGLMKLNFNLPQETLYAGADVSSVVVPGAMGEYEVTADHVPIVAELKAGVLTIKHGDGEEEGYFVPGGFSLTHEGSTTVRADVSLPAGVFFLATKGPVRTCGGEAVEAPTYSVVRRLVDFWREWGRSDSRK